MLLLVIASTGCIGSLFFLWRRITLDSGTALMATLLSLLVIVLASFLAHGILMGRMF
jgi:hypothetical protein